MKKSLVYIFAVILVLIQTSVGTYIKIFGVLPQLALCYCIVYSLTNDSYDSAILGFVCGVLLDSVSKAIFGMNAFLMMYMCITVSYLSRKFYYENKLATSLGVFVYTIIYEAVYLFALQIFMDNVSVFYSLVRYSLLEGVINAALSIIMIKLVKWLNNEYIRGI